MLSTLVPFFSIDIASSVGKESGGMCMDLEARRNGKYRARSRDAIDERWI